MIDALTLLSLVLISMSSSSSEIPIVGSSYSIGTMTSSLFGFVKTEGLIFKILSKALLYVSTKSSIQVFFLFLFSLPYMYFLDDITGRGVGEQHMSQLPSSWRIGWGACAVVLRTGEGVKAMGFNRGVKVSMAAHQIETDQKPDLRLGNQNMGIKHAIVLPSSPVDC
jgi:hypothetical protein